MKEAQNSLIMDMPLLMPFPAVTITTITTRAEYLGGHYVKPSP
jgi:hypothetical protein